MSLAQEIWDCIKQSPGLRMTQLINRLSHRATEGEIRTVAWRLLGSGRLKLTSDYALQINLELNDLKIIKGFNDD